MSTVIKKASPAQNRRGNRMSALFTLPSYLCSSLLFFSMIEVPFKPLGVVKSTCIWVIWCKVLPQRKINICAPGYGFPKLVKCMAQLQSLL